eukprot:PhM_4_TR10730/c0_g1_i1/m.67327
MPKRIHFTPFTWSLERMLGTGLTEHNAFFVFVPHLALFCLIIWNFVIHLYKGDGAVANLCLLLASFVALCVQEMFIFILVRQRRRHPFAWCYYTCEVVALSCLAILGLIQGNDSPLLCSVAMLSLTSSGVCRVVTSFVISGILIAAIALEDTNTTAAHYGMTLVAFVATQWSGLRWMCDDKWIPRVEATPMSPFSMSMSASSLNLVPLPARHRQDSGIIVTSPPASQLQPQRLSHSDSDDRDSMAQPPTTSPQHPQTPSSESLYSLAIPTSTRPSIFSSSSSSGPQSTRLFRANSMDSRRTLSTATARGDDTRSLSGAAAASSLVSTPMSLGLYQTGQADNLSLGVPELGLTPHHQCSTASTGPAEEDDESSYSPPRTMSVSSSRSVQLKQMFVANVSDELRTPVSALCGLLEVMNSDVREKDHYENWRALDGIAGQLLLMVDNLIDVAKLSLDPNGLVVENTPFYVEVFAERLVGVYNAHNLARRVSIIPFIDLTISGKTTSCGDVRRIYQVFANLLQEITNLSIYDRVFFLDFVASSDHSVLRAKLHSADGEPMPRLDMLQKCVDGRNVPRMNVTMCVAAARACNGHVRVVDDVCVDLGVSCSAITPQLVPIPVHIMDKKITLKASSLPLGATVVLGRYLKQWKIPYETVGLSASSITSPRTATSPSSQSAREPHIVFCGRHGLKELREFTGVVILIQDVVPSHTSSSSGSQQASSATTSSSATSYVLFELAWPFFPYQLVETFLNPVFAFQQQQQQECDVSSARADVTSGNLSSRDNNSFASLLMFQPPTPDANATSMLNASLPNLGPGRTPSGMLARSLEGHSAMSSVSASSVNALSVLVVDDNVVIRRVMARKLEPYFHSVGFASCGEEALELLQLQPPGTYDVILMDVEMPRMSGIDLTYQIRSMEKEHTWKRTLIIAVTANAGASDRVLCLESGMDDYICKPLSMDRLLYVLRQHQVISKK